jgi:AcrR family transcriptional regulator
MPVVTRLVTMTASPRAARRSTEEVRRLILRAAGELFEERGYAKTSMRDIAAAAGISLSVLYRQFAGKEELFSATLLAPFLTSFEEFAAAWSAQIDNPWDDERLVREFVRDLYTKLSQHRHSLTILLAVGEDSGSDLLAQTRNGLANGLQELRLMAEHEADRRHWFSRDTVRHSNSLIVSMIAGAVLLQPLLADLRADDDAIIDAATQLALHGMRLAPPDFSAPNGRK